MNKYILNLKNDFYGSVYLPSLLVSYNLEKRILKITLEVQF